MEEKIFLYTEPIKVKVEDEWISFWHVDKNYEWVFYEYPREYLELFKEGVKKTYELTWQEWLLNKEWFKLEMLDFINEVLEKEKINS